MKARDFVNLLLRPGGYEVVRTRKRDHRPIFRADGLQTAHNHDFLRDPRFVAARRRAEQADPGVDIPWRLHMALWAASHALRLEGDFVECGVNRGYLTSGILNYLDWNRQGRRFFLFDTFQGLDESQLSEAERAKGRAEQGRARYRECFEEVRANFAEFERVHLVRGSIPATLAGEEAQGIEQVAYLSIDMNNAAPEVAAAEFFWDKLVPGAVVLLDDYAYSGYEEQKAAMDEFAAGKGVSIASLPTGQGLLLKS
ncbi:MAG: hypothetical protein D6731_11600 [Planctomycetota bacterium]|nr:MAG: hypothetical protein D6731_11600 [Planctomycetota bacterium]